MGGSVGDENVNLGWKQGPFFPKRVSSGKREGPVHKFGLPGTSIEMNSIDRDSSVFEVSPMGESALGLRRLSFQAELVVSGDDELVLKGNLSEPIVEVFEFINGSSVGEISGMNEDIPWG